MRKLNDKINRHAHIKFDYLSPVKKIKKKITLSSVCTYIAKFLFSMFSTISVSLENNFIYR